jgi:hypothetical protein
MQTEPLRWKRYQSCPAGDDSKRDTRVGLLGRTQPGQWADMQIKYTDGSAKITLKIWWLETDWQIDVNIIPKPLWFIANSLLLHCSGACAGLGYVCRDRCHRWFETVDLWLPSWWYAIGLIKPPWVLSFREALPSRKHLHERLRGDLIN